VRSAHTRRRLTWLAPALAIALGCGGARADSGAPDAATAATARAVEVDHLDLVTSPGAPEAAALREAGLRVDGRVTRHQGGGTASMSVLFENAYLELLFPDSAAGDGASSPEEREYWRKVFAWRETGASPIGVGLRRREGAPDALPFPTSVMPPQPWMQHMGEMRLVTTNDEWLAPGVFVVPRTMAVPSWIGRMQRDTTAASPLRHPLGVRRLTGVRVVVARAGGMVPSVARLHEAGVLRVERGGAPLVELTFDGGGRGGARDLRPALPLVLRF
jgi:hypothetical protein